MKNTFGEEMKKLLSKEEYKESETFLVINKLAEKYGGVYDWTYQGDMGELCPLICNSLLQCMEAFLRGNSFTDEEVEEIVDDFEQSFMSAIKTIAYVLKMEFFIEEVREEQ